MSDSPQSNPKDVEQGGQSPDEEAQMNDPTDPQSAGLAFEFEVKEQDRWLPIANGESSPSPLSPMIRETCAAAATAFTVAALPTWLSLHGDRSQSLVNGRFVVCLLCLSPLIKHGVTLMPHEPLSSESPEASRTTFKADKDDVYDANIRNFAPVARIMKNALPENAKIAKEAKECMQECVSEFISFITSEGMQAVQILSSSHKQLTLPSLGEVPPREEKDRQR